MKIYLVQESEYDQIIPVLYNVKVSEEDKTLKIPKSFQKQEIDLQGLFHEIKSQTESLKSREASLDRRSKQFSEQIKDQVNHYSNSGLCAVFCIKFRNASNIFNLVSADFTQIFCIRSAFGFGLCWFGELVLGPLANLNNRRNPLTFSGRRGSSVASRSTSKSTTPKRQTGSRASPPPSVRPGRRASPGSPARTATRASWALPAQPDQTARPGRMAPPARKVVMLDAETRREASLPWDVWRAYLRKNSLLKIGAHCLYRGETMLRSTCIDTASA